MENIVLDAVMLTTTVPINKEDLFIVWSCFILGNRKFLVGCKTNNHYYEVTYNKTKDEWYVDEYTKKCNTCLSNTNLIDYNKVNSNA